MNGALRGFALLALGVGAVAAVGFGLGLLLSAGEPRGGTGNAAATLGGTLIVSGARDGTFQLSRTFQVTEESPREFDGLAGDDGRILFTDEQPVSVRIISYDGLEFYPEPDDCSLTPVNPDRDAEIVIVRLRCEDLGDIRGGGNVGFDGTIGLPIRMAVGRGQPDSGGVITVGDETWTINHAVLYTRLTDYALSVTDWDTAMDATIPAASRLSFTYEPESHDLMLTRVARRGEERDVPEDACQLERRQLGETFDRTTVAEWTIECPGVDVPGLGLVPIIGSLVVDELSQP